MIIIHIKEKADMILSKKINTATLIPVSRYLFLFCILLLLIQAMKFILIKYLLCLLVSCVSNTKPILAKKLATLKSFDTSH